MGRRWSRSCATGSPETSGRARLAELERCTQHNHSVRLIYRQLCQGYGLNLFGNSAWVIAGFLASGGHNTSRAALEFYSQALDILQWSRTVWPEVPREERGSVFDVTFIRGVRRLFLSALVEVRLPFTLRDSDIYVFCFGKGLRG